MKEAAIAVGSVVVTWLATTLVISLTQDRAWVDIMANSMGMRLDSAPKRPAPEEEEPEVLASVPVGVASPIDRKSKGGA